ncbi:B-cell receptor CD22-like protein [Labeo rohita]|uniref:B-cell receptor CD22-like protein n=1 Tax=Labeo rohita TaxID=84645 RepID=A0A498P054_LABRO|nr:B-cell receptor CD22-like protein [Labeo rohita]
MYCLRILTNEEKERYLGYPGIDLKVTVGKQETPASKVAFQNRQESNGTAVPAPTNTADPNELMYASVTHKSPKKHQRVEDEDEVQYATVQHHRNTGNASAEAGCQYGNVRDHRAGSNDENQADDSSVIYSSIKVA